MLAFTRRALLALAVSLAAACAQLPTADAPAPVVFVHGTSRDDKLWPEAHWIELGHALSEEGWRVALPRAGAVETARALAAAGAAAPAEAVDPGDQCREVRSDATLRDRLQREVAG